MKKILVYVIPLFTLMIVFSLITLFIVLTSGYKNEIIGKWEISSAPAPIIKGTYEFTEKTYSAFEEIKITEDLGGGFADVNITADYSIEKRSNNSYTVVFSDLKLANISFSKEVVEKSKNSLSDKFKTSLEINGAKRNLFELSNDKKELSSIINLGSSTQEIKMTKVY